VIKITAVKLSVYKHNELNFVELNITGTEERYNKCDAESRYLDSVVFNLFTQCFEKANQLYDYCIPTKYNTRFIIPLRNNLLANISKLEQLKTLTEFQDYISGKVLGKEFLLALVKFDKNWTDRWMQYHKKLLVVSRDILDLVDFCIDEDRILWVIGY
jgi:hypothetical protein